MANEPITPKLATAPVKESPKRTMDPAAYAAEIRERRGDIRTMESRLGLMADPPKGWEWHWFNDLNGRVEQALADGWRFVRPEDAGMSSSVGRDNDDIGDRVSKVTMAEDKTIKTVLMEIPIELAEELRFLRGGNKVKQFEDTINRGGAAGIGASAHIYNPGDNPQSSFHGIKNHLGQQAA